MKAWQSTLFAVVVAIIGLGTSGARAGTVDVLDEHGGLLMAYQLQWANLAAQKVNVRIVGPCVSACTVLMGYIPRKDICVMPKASFGFHAATMQFATNDLWRAYPPDIRAWITQHGGLTSQLIWLQAPHIYRFFKRCPPSQPPKTAGLN
jgi:hypothetical protein